MNGSLSCFQPEDRWNDKLSCENPIQKYPHNVICIYHSSNQLQQDEKPSHGWICFSRKFDLSFQFDLFARIFHIDEPLIWDFVQIYMHHLPLAAVHFYTASFILINYFGTFVKESLKFWKFTIFDWYLEEWLTVTYLMDSK